MDNDKKKQSNLHSRDVVSSGRWLYDRMNELIGRYRQLYLLIFAALVAFLCFLWTYRYVRIVYAGNDDVQFQEMANGSFSGVPDGHLVYIKYVLGWIISHLYFIDKHFDWYGLTMLGFLFICLLLILFSALEVTRTWKQKILAITAFLVGYALFGLQQISEFQWTIVAGLLAATAIFWLYTSKSTSRYCHFVDLIICALLMLASYMVRSDAFFMSIPFAVVVFLYQNLDWRNHKIHNLILPVSVLIGMGIIFLIEQAAYRNPDWKAYLEFNGLRSQIYDYCGLPAFSENQEFYQTIGVNGEMFDLLARYSFIPNPSANIQTFQAIIDKCKAIEHTKAASTPLFSQAKNVLHELFDTILDGKYALIRNTCIALFIALIARKRIRFNYLEVLFILALIMIPFTEALYLVIQGRLIARVIWVLYLIEVLLLVATTSKDRGAFLPAKKGACQLTIVLLAIVLLIEIVTNKTQAVQSDVQGRVIRNEGCQKVMTYATNHPDNYYFLSTYSFAYCAKTFSIRANDQFNNFSNLGGWEFFSPPLIENYKKHGIEDAQQNLVNRNNILILIKPPDSIKYIVNFYRSIDLNVLPIVVDRIDIGDGSEGFIAYKLEVDKVSIK